MLDGRITVYQPLQDHVAVLDEQASSVWRHAVEQRRLSDIVDAVAAEYHVQPGTIWSEVAATVASFVDAGFLGDPAVASSPRVAATFQLADLVIALDVPAASDAVQLLSLMPPAPSDAEVSVRYSIHHTAGDHPWQLHRNGDRLTTRSRLYLVQKALVADLNRLVRTECDAFSVHAGVVATDDSVVVFPAESGHGKSTLTTACVVEGFRYVSDESLLVSYDDAAVLPYPKPIQLYNESLDLLRLQQLRVERDDDEVYFSAAAVGGTSVGPSERLPVGHVVVPTVERGAQPTLIPLPRSQTVVALLSEAFNHYRNPEAAFDLVHRLAEESQVWSLRVGDPRQTAALLCSELM